MPALTDRPFTRAHVPSCMASPFTGRETDFRGLHADYVADPAKHIDTLVRAAMAQGFQRVTLHRLSGMPAYRSGWHATHGMNPFDEMDPAFARKVRKGLEAAAGLGVEIGVGIMWLVDEADFEFDRDTSRFCGLMRVLSNCGVSVVTHDTAGASKSRLDAFWLERLSDTAADFGIWYIAEGRGEEAIKSGVWTIRVPQPGSEHLPHRQGLPFDPAAPWIYALDADETDADVEAAAALGHPVWSWAATKEVRARALRAQKFVKNPILGRPVQAPEPGGTD